MHHLPVTRLLALLLLLLPTARGLDAQTVTGVFVGNQGNFSDGNASVTFYDPATAQAATALADFGTILQSLLVHDGRVYLASNTGGRIDVLDAVTLARIAQIPDVPGPRYLAVVAENKAYVTNQLFGATSTVTVLDLATNTAIGTIAVGGTPEEIAVRGGTAYVALGGFGASGQVAVIDVATDTVIETLEAGCDGARSLVVDEQDELHVFCTGKTVYNDDFTQIIEQTNGAIVTFDADHEEIGRIALTTQHGSAGPGQNVFYAAAAEEAYVVIDDERQVLRFDTAVNALVDTLRLGGADGIGAVAYDAAGARLYVGRVTGFTTAGYVTIHDRAGTELSRFDAGIAPAHIAFRYERTATATTPVASTRPVRATLHPAYPNPFTPRTTLPLELTRPGTVRLTIVNLLGQTVATLVDGALPAGTHRIRWDAADQPAGVYLARLEVDGRVRVQRLVRVP
ncbi:hypothetical protein AWN76_010935 [Rhodothermaceae bacterium RA]|nr:hypothetical protein AWN76_010935 [Rhodothermaceae bacterium RA]